MASLDDLATAAAATETKAPADADDAAGAEAPPKKRAKKATKLEMAQRLLNAVMQKIFEVEGVVTIAAATGRWRRRRSARRRRR